MKKFRFLFLVPALFSMVACGLGKEVKADKAKEIAQGMKDTKMPDAYEVTIDMKEYDAEDKETATSKYVLKKNGDEFFGSIKSEVKGGEDDGYKYEAEVYKVKNDKYDEVLYTKYYDDDEKKDQISVVVKKDNVVNYGLAVASADAEIASLTVYLTSADQLEAAIDLAEKQAADDENIEVKYYSKGDKNLTIKETMKESDKENAQWGESTITFDKGLLTESKTKLTNKAGDTLEMNITVKYPNSVKISLPSGWEDHIEK